MQQINKFWWHECFLFSTGFYDTSEEVYVAEEPNFKRLRQQNLEGERRTDKEEVNKKKMFRATINY